MKKQSRISIMEVGDVINRRDRDTIISWLIDNRITIHYDKQPYVYKLQVEYQNLKPLILDCKNNYPHVWKEKLKILCDGNTNLYDLFLLEMDNTISLAAPSTRVKPRNKQQEELLKRIYR